MSNEDKSQNQNEIKSQTPDNTSADQQEIPEFNELENNSFEMWLKQAWNWTKVNSTAISWVILFISAGCLGYVLYTNHTTKENLEINQQYDTVLSSLQAPFLNNNLSLKLEVSKQNPADKSYVENPIIEKLIKLSEQTDNRNYAARATIQLACAYYTRAAMTDISKEADDKKIKGYVTRDQNIKLATQYFNKVVSCYSKNASLKAYAKLGLARLTMLKNVDEKKIENFRKMLEEITESNDTQFTIAAYFAKYDIEMLKKLKPADLNLAKGLPAYILKERAIEAEMKRIEEMKRKAEEKKRLEELEKQRKAGKTPSMTSPAMPNVPGVTPPKK